MFADAHGLSGYEDEVAALLRAEMEPLVDEVIIDKMGNVVGIRTGEGPPSWWPPTWTRSG